MDNIINFYEALAKDKELQGRAQKLNEKYDKNKPSEEEMLAEATEFAKAEGFSFTSAELKAYNDKRKAESPEELGTEELEAVVGGGLFGKPDDLHGKCICAFAGGGGGRHTEGSVAWGCGCAGYGQGGDAKDWHWICVCGLGGGGGNL
ncbi:MAG: Nif11-like leader peptide family natural product precursor [Oscillospiraceae bacterium]|nr:Nif11-like leader peptide family natural product precursor [Oscillospiraceae bacterium]